MNDKKFLQEALNLAKKGMQSGAGGPFGAVIVRNGEIVGRGYNSVTSTNDPTAHAEVVAIRDACKNLDTFQLDDCVLYTSCEPCPMCLGAIYWARPQRFVYASSRKDAADGGFDDDFIYREIPMPPADRSIKATQAMREEGNQLFEEWLKMDDRTEY